MDFDSIFAEAVEATETRRHQLEKVWPKFNQIRPSRLVTEGGPLLLTIVVTSAISFIFVALFFRYAVSLPSQYGEAPEGEGSWTACSGSSGHASAVTELGRQLPYSRVRTIVSLPKLFGVAMLSSLMLWLMVGRLSRFALVHAMVQFALVVVAVPPYLVVEAMPSSVDPVITFVTVLIGVATASWLVRARQSSSQVVARCPKFLCSVALMGITIVCTSMHAILIRMDSTGADPSLIVCISIVIIRCVSFAARQVFKSLKMPFLFCFSVLFIYDVTMLVAVRRYWLVLPSLSDVAASAAVSGLVEFVCNGAAAIYAISTYNAMVGKGLTERASVQINIFFTAIISELIAEHVALHGSFGYNLFIDTRVLSVKVVPGGAQMTEAWALSFAIEIVVDLITVAPMILFLPVSLRYLFGKCWRSWPVVLFIAVACVHPHLSGLQAYVEPNRYFCE